MEEAEESEVVGKDGEFSMSKGKAEWGIGLYEKAGELIPEAPDDCLHQGRWVGSHVGEGGQQGYPGHWGLGSQQQAERQDM